MEESGCKVCVTAAASYIGSSLVKKLLEKGYTVHATLRNINDESKAGLLKSFPNAKTRLKLFEADIYAPETFEPAIKGCRYVFHLAHPMFYAGGIKHADGIEASVNAAKSIASACVKSGTVKRLIYTATVCAASPLKEDSDGYKDFMDETCWSPLQHRNAYSNDGLVEYTDAKTVTEKELLDIFKNNPGGVELVTLAIGMVGGETCLPEIPSCVQVIYSPLSNNKDKYNILKYLEELLGKVPIAHIEDIIEAHVFCMDAPSLTGRVLCSSSYVSAVEIAQYYQQRYPESNVRNEYLIGPTREIEWRTTRLTDHGFKFKYDLGMLLDDCVSFARKRGDLQLQKPEIK